MRLLHLTHSMNPAHGGVSTCVSSLVAALADLGHESAIVSLDSPTEQFIANSAVPIIATGPGRFAFGYSRKMRKWLDANSGSFDGIVVHGLWQYPGLAVHTSQQCQMSKAPYFVFPHGMLDPWFRRNHPLKHLKKLTYWWTVERRVLRDAAAVLFSCKREMELARKTYPFATYVESIVGLGSAAPRLSTLEAAKSFRAALPALNGRPYWLFLGRIHPKKGVDLLIEAYVQLSTKNASLPILVIAGPCANPFYLKALSKRAGRSRSPAAIVWPGMLGGTQKWGALKGAEAFILPSHQENFGLAVTEALSCGTPVLISDQINIASEIAANHAGFTEPDTFEGTLRLLERWQDLGELEREQMRESARRTFDRSYNILRTARELITTVAITNPRRFHQ